MAAQVHPMKLSTSHGLISVGVWDTAGLEKSGVGCYIQGQCAVTVFYVAVEMVVVGRLKVEAREDLAKVVLWYGYTCDPVLCEASEAVVPKVEAGQDFAKEVIWYGCIGGPGVCEVGGAVEMDIKVGKAGIKDEVGAAVKVAADGPHG